MSFIEFDGNRIFYQIKGQGEPILFGHSFLWDSQMWHEVSEILKSKYLCVLVDLPGHGKSESIEDLSLEKLAELHKAVMLHLSFSSFSLIGLSIGAMWGSLLCQDKEVNVEKFIIMNSSLSPEPNETKELYLGMLNLIEAKGLIPDSIIDQIAPGFFCEKYISEHIDSFKESLKSCSAEQLKSIIACGRAFVKRGDLLTSLKKFKNNVYVFAGEFDRYRSIQESNLISTAFEKKTKIIPAGHISAKGIPQELCLELQKILSG